MWRQGCRELLGLDYAGASHHVIGRGIEKRYILEVAEDKSFFLEKLIEVTQGYDFRCYGGL